MYILGINAYHGDSSACLLKNGVLLSAVEEERFRRIKHWAGFPSEAIKFCLEQESITINDIDFVTVSRDPKVNLVKKVLYLLRFSSNIFSIRDRLLNSRRINSIKLELAKTFSLNTSDIDLTIYNIEHHRSHIASSFFASGFHESAILSIDGFGDFTSTMTAYGISNRINVLNQINYPHSLGILYTAMTQFLGFPNYGDEYKVMGLAPYGNPIYFNHLEKMLILDKDAFYLNDKYFSHFKNGVSMNWDNGIPFIDSLYTLHWIDLFGLPRKRSQEIKKIHFDLASSVQKFTEHIIFNILNSLYSKTGSENICITGGVAQNSVVNGKILDNTSFKRIYIPSAGHDAGTSIGSALFLYNHIFDKPRLKKVISSNFGPSLSQEDIIQYLNKESIDYSVLLDDDLFDRVSDKIIQGGIIGWVQGKAEFGPRALGNRSILADPRRKDAKELINNKIKRRESFRPFAPSILKEKVSEYFVQDDIVPFMEKVFEVKKTCYHKIPAVTHIDGTGRLQSVDKDVSPKFYKLISNFESKTGVPILLNTSFNENEPIVNSIKDALDCFLRTDMDMLVLENVIIER